MKVGRGWIRLWLLLTVMLVMLGIFQTYRVPDIVNEIGSPWYCLPGTYSSRIEQVEDGYSSPSEPAIREEVARLGRIEPGSDELTRQIVASTNLREPRYRDVTYFSCSSYLGLLRNIIMALAASVAAAVVFCAVRWVAAGFTQSN